MSKKVTTSEFVQKAAEIHGVVYDYSMVEYVNSKIKVTIICSDHGKFFQTPNDHLSGHGCPKCMNRSQKRLGIILPDACSKCGGTILPFMMRNPPICKKCYVRPTGICSICGETGRIEKRLEDDTTICYKCYKVPSEKCSDCGRIKPVYKRETDGRVICNLCFQKTYSTPEALCAMCGEIKPAYQRRVDDSVICRLCYNRNYQLPVEKCSRCQKQRKVFRRLESGLPLCKSCNNAVRCQTDEAFRVRELIRRRVKDAFRKYSRIGKIQPSRKYGIDYQAIFAHLGPCPGNRDAFHIDHIVPLALFDFDDPRQVAAAFAPENHQWLLVANNLSKSARCDPQKASDYFTAHGLHRKR